MSDVSWSPLPNTEKIRICTYSIPRLSPRIFSLLLSSNLALPYFDFGFVGESSLCFGMVFISKSFPYFTSISESVCPYSACEPANRNLFAPLSLQTLISFMAASIFSLWIFSSILPSLPIPPHARCIHTSKSMSSLSISFISRTISLNLLFASYFKSSSLPLAFSLTKASTSSSFERKYSTRCLPKNDAAPVISILILFNNPRHYHILFHLLI